LADDLFRAVGLNNDQKKQQTAFAHAWTNLVSFWSKNYHPMTQRVKLFSTKRFKKMQ
jgi:hypothetical protein